MELRHLRYFVAVAEEEHYGRAAQRLRVAQPALSRQIQDLEREIGFQLFDRLPRGVRLSAAGRALLEDARLILRQVNEATMRAERVARGLAGNLRVGFTESAAWPRRAAVARRAWRGGGRGPGPCRSHSLSSGGRTMLRRCWRDSWPRCGNCPRCGLRPERISPD